MIRAFLRAGGMLPVAGMSLLLALSGSGCDDVMSGSAGTLPAGYEDYAVAVATTDHGCAELSDAAALPPSPWCADDEFDFTVDGTALRVFHVNAKYNCCPQQIRILARVVREDGRNLIAFDEEEFLDGSGCFCACCHEVETAVRDLTPGRYLVRYCWIDRGERACHVERIEIS